MSSLKSSLRSPLSRAVRSVFSGEGVSVPAMGGTFFVNLSNPVNMTVSDAQGVGTITRVGNMNPVATANRVSGVAPLAVQFDATGTTASSVSLPFRDLYHAWNFGDNDTVTWSYGTRPGVSKKNRASNAIAGHVFETPGTYTVTYGVTNPLTGATGVDHVTVTVQDPDVVFASNTVYVSTGTLAAGVGDVPLGANVASNVTTNAAIAALAATYKRILLKRGDTWTAAATANLDVAGPGLIGTFGSGAKPKIAITATAATVFQSSNGVCQDWRFVDIETEATALATGAARNATSLFGAVFANQDSGRFNTFLRCEHHHAATFVTMGHDTTIADCNLYVLDGGSGNVGIWTSQRERVSILGTNVDDATQMEMNIRLQGTKKAAINNCFIKDPMASGIKHALAIRGWSNSSIWTGDYTEHVYVTDNHIEGIAAGNGVVQFESVNGTSDERHRYIVFERNYVKCKKDYGGCVSASVSYSAFRNNLFELTSGAATGLKLGDSPATTGNGNAILPPVDVQVFNNTTYSGYATTNAGQSIHISSANASNIAVKNNAAYLPNFTGTVKTLLAAIGADYTASNNSSDAQADAVSPSFAVTPPITYVDWKPVGGYMIDGGVTAPLYDDFFNLQRTGTFDMGAALP